MTTMTVAAWPDNEITFAELDAMPDDGNRYELVDGMLLVTPAPVPLHQRAVVQLLRALSESIPDDLEVFVAPLDFRPTDRRSLEPDVLVVRREDVGKENITEPLLLAVEVLSPSTRLKDLRLKHAVYEESGVTSYWVVDPKAPSFTAYELTNGKYVEVANVEGAQTWQATLPYAVEICPAALVR